MLIEEYALQFRGHESQQGTGKHICYQEEYGNQDVAPVVINARREIQEKQGGAFTAKKR